MPCVRRNSAHYLHSRVPWQHQAKVRILPEVPPFLSTTIPYHPLPTPSIHFLLPDLSLSISSARTVWSQALASRECDPNLAHWDDCEPGPLRWLPGAARQSLIRPGVCSCCWFGILGWTDWSTESQHWYCRLCLRVSLSLSPLLLFWRRSYDRFLSVASKKILTQLRLELPNADDRLMRTQNKTQTHTQEALWFGYKVPLKT